MASGTGPAGQAAAAGRGDDRYRGLGASGYSGPSWVEAIGPARASSVASSLRIPPPRANGLAMPQEHARRRIDQDAEYGPVSYGANRRVGDVYRRGSTRARRSADSKSETVGITRSSYRPTIPKATNAIWGLISANGICASYSPRQSRRLR